MCPTRAAAGDLTGVQITPGQRVIVQGILRTVLPKDVKIWVFGSRAKGKARPASDLDLAVDAGRALSLHEMGVLAEAFDEAPLPYGVDVIDVRSIDTAFKTMIERDWIEWSKPMVSKLVFQSSRSFELYSYSGDRGQMLLRSRKKNDAPSRIDLLITDVRAMEIRCWLDGIMIEEVDVHYLAEFSSKPDQMIEPGNKVYAIIGGGWRGYVLGGLAFTGEDDGEYGAPSGKLAPLN